MHAGRIIVMRAGRIVEIGSHKKLLEENGYYAELYNHSQGKNQMRMQAWAKMGVKMCKDASKPA